MEQRITEDRETLEEASECQSIEALTALQQQLQYLHRLEQFEAVPCYVEQQARQFAQEETQKGVLYEHAHASENPSTSLSPME